jgi:hypothetical protein
MFQSHISVFSMNVDLIILRLKSFPCTGAHRPIGLKVVQAPRISRQSAQESGKIVTPVAPATFVR